MNFLKKNQESQKKHGKIMSKKGVLRYFKHLSLTILILLISIIFFGLYHGAGLRYSENPIRMELANEGPYVFYENDSILSVNYINGNQNEGFYTTKKEYLRTADVEVTSNFALDSTQFQFSLKRHFKTPETTYNDGNKILAISDIESGYKAFRDFLINSGVIDKQLNWRFGNGHLVLVGDFVDRGFSTTQVLWFIYRLEQEAEKAGGKVHFILGNHELKNMHGNYGAAEVKYFAVSYVLEKQQFELYNQNSLMGKWLASKNTVELINGNLFVHGGIHPDLADMDVDLIKINAIVRQNYYKPFYPKQKKGLEQFLISTKTGPSWYRGYFKDDLSQEEVERGLEKFGAKVVIVGHTIQRKVNSKYKGKVIGIDVKHPKDYRKNWPKKRSEGLLIEDGIYYRVLDNGKRIKL